VPKVSLSGRQPRRINAFNWVQLLLQVIKYFIINVVTAMGNMILSHGYLLIMSIVNQRKLEMADITGNLLTNS